MTLACGKFVVVMWQSLVTGQYFVVTHTCSTTKMTQNVPKSFLKGSGEYTDSEAPLKNI